MKSELEMFDNWD